MTPTVFTQTTGVSYTTKDTGFYTMDRVTLDPQWQVIAGLRHSKYESDQDVTRYKASETTPMIALVYKPLKSVSLYASYSEGLEEGKAAPTGTQNESERLNPGVSKQYELGAH
ncbi:MULTISPECIES: TonB-dependent receptor [unclassified Sulfurospirillum]|uniref:TonB-dependent receptor domain-containing protein n=1 Tax=unclassified Sulfurospirillum TaxID=2618290 RepID=UPI0025D97132|nr:MULTISPECIES: TonB-dependent receptor [unclassified Sulfurospirillum]